MATLPGSLQALITACWRTHSQLGGRFVALVSLPATRPALPEVHYLSNCHSCRNIDYLKQLIGIVCPEVSDLFLGLVRLRPHNEPLIHLPLHEGRVKRPGQTWRRVSDSVQRAVTCVMADPALAGARVLVAIRATLAHRKHELRTYGSPACTMVLDAHLQGDDDPYQQKCLVSGNYSQLPSTIATCQWLTVVNGGYSCR